MRWFGAKPDFRAGTQVTVAPDGTMSISGHDVPDEWVTLIAQTMSKGGTTNLSFGNGSSTAE